MVCVVPFPLEVFLVVLSSKIYYYYFYMMCFVVLLLLLTYDLELTFLQKGYKRGDTLILEIANTINQLQM